MSARERRPHDALAIDVHAARRIAGERRLEHFGEGGLRRIRSQIQADDVARVSQHRAPDRAVDRARGEPVEAGHDALVLLRVDRIVRPHVIVAPAVAVGVQNERGPALRLLLIAGFLEHLSVEPSEDLVRCAAGARPQSVVGILGEVQMMRAETGVDERELPGFRIVHGELAVGAFDGKDLRRRMIRPFSAEGRVRRPAHARGEPDPALLVEHRVVRARLAVPDRLRSPIRRRRHRVAPCRRRFRIADRHFYFARRMPHRVQDRNEIRALLGRPVNQSVSIDRGIALVARDLVVQVGGGAAPVPQGDDDVALQALRPLGLRGGQLARGDAVGPVGKLAQHPRSV